MGKKDWEDIGRELRDEWPAREEHALNEALREHLKKVRRPDPDELVSSRAWIAAVNRYIAGDTSLLIDYLRSDHPFDRRTFASVLELMNQPLPRGRPYNEDMRELAERADKFYREWKERNQIEGINDWGVRDSMKHQSCVYVLEIDSAYWDESEDGKLPDPEAIMQLLSRPKSRRKSKG